jgi:hypothetical protein
VDKLPDNVTIGDYEMTKFYASCSRTLETKCFDSRDEAQKWADEQNIEHPVSHRSCESEAYVMTEEEYKELFDE